VKTLYGKTNPFHPDPVGRARIFFDLAQELEHSGHRERRSPERGSSVPMRPIQVMLKLNGVFV